MFFFCHNCGEKINENDIFCEFCGHSTKGEIREAYSKASVVEKKNSSFFKMKYVFSVVFAFIEICLTLAVLDNTSYSNKDIISGLIIIYASIRTLGISLGLALNNTISALAADLLKIKERIRKDESTEEEWNILLVQVAKKDENNIKIIIRSVGVAIIYLIGVFSILG